MIELELDSLEAKIDELLALLQQTRLENSALHKKIAILNNENISLLDKNKKATESVKKLIMHLQDNLG